MTSSIASLETLNPSNPDFQEQLIQEYLLDHGKITPEQLSQALARLRQIKVEQQREQQAVSYVVDQKGYALKKVNPWTSEIIETLILPTHRKFRPRFFGVDWIPSGSGSVYLFHASNARELGEIDWPDPENNPGGITVSDRFTHLYFGELDDHPYLALSQQLHYGFFPISAQRSLPLDLLISPSGQHIFVTDRGRGAIFVIDVESFKISGILTVRPAGSKKTLHLAPSLDGLKLYITDNQTPSLLIVNLKTLKIKRQPLPYGILGNIQISVDGQWLYLQSTRPDESVEIIVVDTLNLLLKATVPLKGNLFSSMDDPCDLMAISPLNNFMVFMTYVDVPSMFTPWLNIIDLEANQLIDRYALFAEDTKPSFLAFATSKPDGYFRSDTRILDVLLDLNYISFQDVEEAEWTIHETMGKSQINKAFELSDSQISDPIESDIDFSHVFELDAEDEAELEAFEKERGNPEEDYPVLNDHQLDPSILIQFKETLLRRYEFVPINQLNGIFRVAAVNPGRPEIEMITQKLFPDLPLYLIPFEKDEFDRFMREFYAQIITRMKKIVSRMTPGQREEFASTAPVGVMENLLEQGLPPVPDAPTPEPKVADVETEKDVPLSIHEQAKKDLPPSAKTEVPAPSNESVSVQGESQDEPNEVDFSAIPTEKINDLLSKYCLNEFRKIWGIDLSGEVEALDTLLPFVDRARKELLNFDYTIIRIPDLFNQFSLETVITKNVFKQLLEPLLPNLDKGLSNPLSTAQPSNLQEIASRAKETPQQSQHPSQQSVPKSIQFEADDQVLRSDDLPNDHFLIHDIERQRIIEFTNKGQIIWQIGGKDGIGQLELLEPANPIRLPSGNTLFSDAGSDTVYEVSKSGQVRWQFPPADKSSEIKLHRPLKAMRKLNGNTIIVDQGNHRIIEINPQNKIVWQYGITTSVGITRGRLYSPSDMQVLKGGHFLITDTDNHRVIEVNQDEEIIWQFGNPDNKLGSGYGSHSNQLNAPTQAFRLPNGNTLISDSENRRVIEVSPEREIVWIFDTGIEKASGGAFSFIPNRLIRMGNGNTVVFSSLYVIEVTRLLRPLYLYQYATLPKHPEYDKLRLESGKIVELSSKPSNERIHELARQATQTYVTSKTNLLDLELPLIDKQENRVYIINRQKQIVWRFGESHPRSAEFIERPQYVAVSEREDSEVLLTDTDRHRVIRIYRPTKEIIWQYGESGIMGSRPGLLGHPRSAVPTPSGTILITDQYSGRVLEINELKQIVWSFGGWDSGINPLNAPYYAEVTPDDTILITDWSNHYVIEVNREGEIVWQYGTLKNPGNGPHQLMYPERAMRLINGNTLILDTRNHRVLEVDPAGGVFWQFGGLNSEKSHKKISNPTAAYRLDNGHTVIVHSGNRQVLEVTHHSEVVWTYLLPSKVR
jgi:DNA-binding beta-propeller fold protein YncE